MSGGLIGRTLNNVVISSGGSSGGGVIGSVRRSTVTLVAISTSVITQFAPVSWTTDFDTTPTSVSGHTLVVPSGLNITKALVTAALPMLSCPAGGITMNVRKNSAIIAGCQGFNATPCGGNMSVLISCTAGDVFDLAYYTVTGSGNVNSGASLFGSGFICAVWM